MKKLIIVLLSLFILTGCESTSLKKSDVLPQYAKQNETLYDVEFISLSKSLDYKVKENALINCIEKLNQYIETLNSYTFHDLIQLNSLNNLIVYSTTGANCNKVVYYIRENEMDSDLNIIYQDLIVIRNNMISLGMPV